MTCMLMKEMATYSSIAWGIPWVRVRVRVRREKPGRLQFTGSQRVRHDLVTKQQGMRCIHRTEYFHGPKSPLCATYLSLPLPQPLGLSPLLNLCKLF